MVRIALTGAAGTIGRNLLGAFGDEHDLVPFTHSAGDDFDAERLDVTDAADVTEKLDGFDAVIHLAGEPSPDADWESVVETNVRGTKHVLDAAVGNGVDRVVFASSNHAVGAYNAAEGGHEDMPPGDVRAVPADAPTRPDSFYGVSKAACEDLGKFYAHRYGLEVVNLRLGWYMSEADLRATVEDGEPNLARFARATWLGPRDCQDVHRKAATAELSTTPVTVNAVSRNADRFHAITETMLTLGYEPREDASEALDGD